MFRTHHVYHVDPTDFLDKVFTNKVLPSGFINKARCSIGGTKLEIDNKERCSIITVSHTSIIKSKKAQNEELDDVYGDITKEQVLEYLRVKKQGQKIMTTPEGMWKIMWAAEELGRTQELLNEWFLMLDECHTFITEAFRDDILIPFNHFWEFKNKCLISATPYFFSDPRMNQLDYHEVKLNAKLGDVTLVKSLSVEATLEHILRNPNEFPGNIHIAYNSVTEIVKAIARAGIIDCNIYCADDKENNNMKKIGDYKHFYEEQPSEHNYKKINFYTCKYFEGWDMYDEKATLILATNIHREHTKVGVSDKGVQFFGRLRGKKDTSEPPKPYQLIHITNSSFNNTMKEHDTIVTDCTHAPHTLVEQHNTNQEQLKELKTSIDVERFAEVDEKTNLAILNHNLLDQLINELSRTEVYHNIKFIKEAWELKYNVEQQHSQLQTQTMTTIKRKSKQQQFKEDYQSLLAFKEERGITNHLWTMQGSVEQEIKKRNPIADKAIQLLTPTLVEELKYNPKKVELEIIIKHNEDANIKLFKLLDQYFKVGRFYTNEFIEATLQKLYNRLKISNKDGKIKVAYPADLGKEGRFEVSKDKGFNSKGVLVHGYKILRKQFTLLVAA
jgi:hypothetical protein